MDPGLIDLAASPPAAMQPAAVMEQLQQVGLQLKPADDEGQRLAPPAAPVLPQLQGGADASVELLQPAKKAAGKDMEGFNAENRMLFFAKVLRSATEGEVKALFTPFGRVYDVNLFRAFQGAPTTKGCGLVTMGSHDEAQAAIDALDNKYVWEGMESPMVVKWMDAALQRRRREQHLAAMRSGLIPSHSMGSASTLPDNWLPTGFALSGSLMPNSRGAALGLQAAAGGMLPQDVEAQEHPPAGCAPDAIKLFVGNIPKSCTEQQLLPFFETIGKVVELVIVRDKTFHESKGSAFVWYATRALAERAILQFNLRHVLPDPSGEQTRPLVVRKAKVRTSPAQVLPMSLGMMGGPGPRMMDPSLHLAPGQRMSAQGLVGLPQYMAPVGPGMLGASGLEAMAPPSAIAVPQPGLGMMGYGMSQVPGGLPGMGRLQGPGSQQQQEAGLFESYGAPGQEQLDSFLHGAGGTGNGSTDVDQVIMSAAVSQNQLTLVNSHLYSIQTMSGAQLNIMIGAPGIFHLVVSGTKAQVDSARALLYSVMGGG